MKLILILALSVLLIAAYTEAKPLERDVEQKISDILNLHKPMQVARFKRSDSESSDSGGDVAVTTADPPHPF